MLYILIPFGCFSILIIIVLIILGIISYKSVQKNYIGILERIGTFKKLVEPGKIFIIPFIDNLILVNMAEDVISVGPVLFFTKDEQPVEIALNVHFQIIDPYKSHYEVFDLNSGVIDLTIATLNNIVSRKDLKDIESDESKNDFTKELFNLLNNSLQKWGTRVNTIKIIKIEHIQTK